MPPPVVKTVKDLIFWQYAKIIADSAGFGKTNYRFVMAKFRQLKEGEIFWNEIREYVKEREKKDECIFCGAKKDLTIDHLLPRCFNGPDDEKNVIWVCKRCNSSKGSKRLYEFWTVKKRAERSQIRSPHNRRGKIPKTSIRSLKTKKHAKPRHKRNQKGNLPEMRHQKTMHQRED